MRSARNLYRLSLTLAAVGVCAVLVGGAVALGRIQLSRVPGGRLLSYCRRFLLPGLTPGGLAVLGLGLLGAVVLVRAARSAWRQVRCCRRFLRALDVVDELPAGETRVLLIAASAPRAFCAGFVRPRIYLSSAAGELLTSPQLEAVVAHEMHHAARRDPLRILSFTVLGDALFFLPALRRLKQRYQELAEIAADEAALATTGDPSLLAAALLRFGDSGVPGVVAIASERVDHLFGSPPGWRLPRVLMIAALITVAALIAVVWTAARLSSAGTVNLTLLAAQSCMIAMVTVPPLALTAIAFVGRRMVSVRDR